MSCINVGRPNELCGRKAWEIKQAAHRLNKTGRIRISFKTRQGGKRFENYLGTASAHHWLENLNLKAGEIHAHELYEIERKAQIVGEQQATTSGDACKAAGAAGGTVLNIIGYSGAAETGGASLLLNGVGIAWAWAASYAC